MTDEQYDFIVESIETLNTRRDDWMYMFEFVTSRDVTEDYVGAFKYQLFRTGVNSHLLICESYEIEECIETIKKQLELWQKRQ